MSNKKISRILITGGAGYIGSVVSEYLLNRGYEVSILDLFIYGQDSVKSLANKVKFIKGDVRNNKTVNKALSNVDAVIHLAGIVGAPESSRIPEVTWEINYEATKNLVRQIKRNKIPRLIFVSTCSNYGISGDTLVDEDAELNPISPYAESKVAAEKHILSKVSSTFHPVICRLATVFGLSPRMRFDLLVNQFLADAFKKKELTILGHQGRTFVHVKDVARVFDLLLNADIEQVSGEVYNVGSTKESNLTKSELGRLVAEVVPEVKLTILEKDLDARDYKVSFDKIYNNLGFDIEYTVKDGVEEMYHFLKENPDLDPYNPIYSNLNKYLDLK